ncbi:chemosensory receptor C [Elysia marginata]|uniref:Chemosensory receptor C n=1 Tax=Elysia marginata TaxID=1093978 RepID=A0AAV4FN48_9GAST|nr:chemosensory receptor C [Elysia marginata]
MRNVSTSLASVSPPPSSLAVLTDPLISSGVADILMATFCFLVLTFSMPAVVLNILNIYIFINTKIDSITVCFISLSISDLSSMLLLTHNAITGFLIAYGVPWGKNLRTYAFLFTFPIGLSVDTSSATTTYIALQRGLCVALPFLTRHLFNKNRSLVICVSVFLFILACSTPRATSIRLKTIHDFADNTSTILTIQYLKYWRPFDSFYTIFVKTALVCIEFCVMIVCASLISYGMKSSMKLKLNSSSQSSQPQPHDSGKMEQKNNAGSRAEEMNKDKEKSRSGKEQSLTKKEAKESLVMKQSLMVVLIHIIFTTPRMLASLFVVFEPRYRVGGEYQNLYFVSYSSISVTDSINAFANFFVYLRFNSKFRKFFEELCGHMRRS